MRLLSIISLCTMLCATTQAQDSTYITLEQYKLLNSKLRPYYDSPALKKLNTPVTYTDMNISYAQENADQYMWQKGSGFNSLTINITSFLEKKNNLNLWGEFNYDNNSIKDVNFNETLDYEYLYPYIMADTVGGNLRNEHYTISGGLSKTYNKTTFGLESTFLGKQSIRNRDPRTHNISANFNVTLSISQQINSKYNLGFGVLGERYFQKAKVDFNSELGRPNIVHETGFGNYNSLLAGTRDNSEYLGYNYGLSLHFVPSDQLGWFAVAKYTGSTIDKRIKDLAQVMNEAYKDNFQVQLSYKLALATNSKLEFGSHYTEQKLKGVEGKYHIEQSLMAELGKENLFNSSSKNIGGYASFQQSNLQNDWFITLGSSYLQEDETYITPVSNTSFDFFNLSGQFGWNQKISKNLLSLKLTYNYSNPLTAKGEWNSFSSNSYRYEMLTNNFNYKNTQANYLNFSTKVSFPIPKLQTLYLGANVSYVSVYELTHFGVTSGFVF